MAARAVRGEHFVTGDVIAQQRRKDVPMNAETRGLRGGEGETA